LTHDGIEKSFHKFGEVNDREIAGDSPFFCPSAMISRSKLTVAASAPRQFGRTNRVHRAGKDHSLPERSPHFGHISQSFVKSRKRCSVVA